jgi:adenosylhomocysteine nucleosidase
MPNILLVSATHLEHHDEELFGIPIHIVGVGKVNAALNTYKLIQKYKPDHVINFGSCGNLKNYKVGDVLEVGEVHDDFYGCVVPEHIPLKVSNSTVKLFTTDIFYNTEAVYSNKYMSNIRNCDIVDMEGYSIAKVCQSENISLSLYKWISDDGESTHWLKNAAAGYSNFKTFLYKWLEQQK